MLVKIKRDSIKRNEKAGNETTVVNGSKALSGSYYGKLPERYSGHLIVTETHTENGQIIEECFANSGDPTPILNLLYEDCKNGLASIEITHDPIVIHHQPEPSYFYTYEDPLMKCEECGKESLLSDIEDYDDDGNPITVCPFCHEIDTFERVTYESIDEALKDTGEKNRL